MVESVFLTPSLSALRQWLNTDLKTSPFEQLVWLSMDATLIDAAYRKLFLPTPEPAAGRMRDIQVALAARAPTAPPPGPVTLPDLQQWLAVGLTTCTLMDLVWLDGRAYLYATTWPESLAYPPWLTQRRAAISQALGARLAAGALS